MTPVKSLLVGNPTAQSGRNAARIERARALLARAGVAHDFLATLPGGRTVGAVAEALAAGGYDAALYMGGDGTFAEVAKGILASGRAAAVRLGMLPTGTANDQGKSFGLSADEDALPDNVRVIAEGHETALDAGRITALDERGDVVREDWFFDSAGWGISPRVLALRNEDRKVIAEIPVVRDLWRDQLVYAGALARTFLESYVEDDAFDVELRVDGVAHRWRDLTDLIVKGTKIYGGLWVLDPTARHDDGEFEVVPFVGRSDWLSKALVHLDHSGEVSATLEDVGVSHSPGTRGAAIELALHAHPGGLPLAAQIDGEEFPATARARVDVVPRALRVIVPPGP